MEALNDIVRAGKARYIGVSTMLTGQLAKILLACERHGWAKPINMQLQLNCAYREEEREMIPFCRDQGLGVSVFSPLARGLLTGDVQSTRNQTDFFTQQMYSDEASFAIARSVQRVAQRHGVSNAQVAQAWVLQHPGWTACWSARTPRRSSTAPWQHWTCAWKKRTCTNWSATTRPAT